MTASDYEHGVSSHYGGIDFAAEILDRVRAAGGDPDNLRLEDIGSLDQLHAGGRAATEALAEFAELRPEEHVLDVGSGLGGPARTLAARFGCSVTGLDLSPDFCRAATVITERVGLAEKIRFEQGSALNMPFAEASFDVAWMHNVGMNIPDKERLYAEIYRVLRPGGRLVMSEYLGGPLPDPHFPLPWAPEPSLSFVRSAPEIRALLATTGFRERRWTDATANQQQMRAVGEGLNLTNVLMQKMGPATQVVGQNLTRNLTEGRLVNVEALLEKP